MSEIKKHGRAFSIKEARTELLYSCLEIPCVGDDRSDKKIADCVKCNKKARRCGRRTDATAAAKERGVDTGEKNDESAEQSRELLFDRYYYSAAAYAEEWARRFADGQVRSEYEQLGVRERKFSFKRYIYSLKYDIEETDKGDTRVVGTYTLMRSGKIIFQKQSSELWDLRNNHMIKEKCPLAKDKIKQRG